MPVFIHDLRQALRMLVKNPGFATAAILTLGLGIGANTAIFSIVDGVLLQPLPYKNPDELASIVTTLKQQNSRQSASLPVSFTKFTRVQERSHALQSVAAYHPIAATLSTHGVAEQIPGARASANFFDVLAVRVARGRTFLPEEDREGSSTAAIITDRLWRTHFGADPNILGASVPVDGETVTIVGVLPASFQMPLQQPEPELWLSHVFFDADLSFRVRYGATYLTVFGRVKPGEGLAGAQSELDVINAAYAADNPDFVDARNCTLTIAPLKDSFVRPVRVSLWTLLSAVGFVLMIGCANIASMLLARAAARTRETAIRRALGASPLRLVCQFLTESLLLAFLGGIVGVLVALASTRVVRLLPAGLLPRADEIHINTAVLCFTLTICALTGIVCGLLPSFQLRRKDLQESLKDGGRNSSISRTGGRMCSFLVVTEVAVAMVLLAGAGILIASFANLMRVDPGFEARGVTILPLHLPPVRYREPAQGTELFHKLESRVRLIPDVQAAGLVSALPLSGDDSNVYFCPQTLVCQGIGKDPIIAVAETTPDYFAAMHIPLRRGRVFDEHDTGNGRRVAVITESVARHYFRGQDPIGKTLAFSRNLKTPLEIVGVVGDVRYLSLKSEDVDQLYVPQTQNPTMSMALVVRSNSQTASAVRRALRDVDPELSFSTIRSMGELLSGSVARPRLIAAFVSVFAALALLLAALGTYGVLAYSVAQRTREMGVRMALGAGKPQILKLVVGQGMRLVLAGMAIGFVAALILTRLIRTLVFGTTAVDEVAFGAVAILLWMVGLIACYIPARRAAGVDAVFSLKSE